jgi:hypothetical protein
LGYLLDISPKDLEKVLYFASSIITSVDEQAREEDMDELRDELAADLEELDAERDRRSSRPAVCRRTTSPKRMNSSMTSTTRIA